VEGCDITTARKSRGSHFFNTLAEKKVLFVYIFPPRCATGEFKDKQNQEEVLSNTANITNVVYEVSHLDT